MAKKGGEAVMVVVRMRPFNSKEKNEGRGPCISLDVKTSVVSITNPSKTGDPPKSFTFDAVYDIDTQQKHFYEESCYQMIESVLDGFNGTIFAYGQTGCGKTWTMQGLNHPPELRGVIPISFDHIFQSIKADPATQFLVRCSYLEIYNEEVRDLLGVDSTVKLNLKEDPGKGVFVKDLTEEVVKDVEGINKVMDKGFAKRTVGATLMNAGSSRSHSIFTVIIEASESVEGSDKDKIRAGKLNLVDLAGSERSSKTGATGDRLKEGSQINLSLSALGNVISALVDGKGKHIPYRDSKLTRLLQDSLGGNTKTLMVAAISPADYNYDETLSTLRYANRAKNIKNKPKINEDPKDAMLREYKEEIERLKEMLEAQAKGLPLPSLDSAPAAAPPQRVELAPIESPRTPAVTMPPGMEMAPAIVPSAGPPGMSGPPGMQQEAQEKIVVERVVERVVETVEVEKIVEVDRPVEVAVVPKDLLDQKKALLEYNQSIVDQRNQLGEKLITKEGALMKADGDKSSLQSKLMELQNKMMNRLGVSPDDAEELAIEIARKEREARRVEAKLRAKRRNEHKLEAERQQAEAEKKEAEEELKNAKEEAESAEKKQTRHRRKLEKKLVAARAEVEDLTSEFHRERHDLLQSIRDQNREIKLLEKVLASILPSTEISKIWERSTYDTDADEWKIPSLKPRKEFQNLNLPSLGGGGDASEKPKKKEKKHRTTDDSRIEKRRNSRGENELGTKSAPTSREGKDGQSVGNVQLGEWGFAENTHSNSSVLCPSFNRPEEGGERAPSRQGGSRAGSRQPTPDGGEQKVSLGRVRPKSGHRSHGHKKSDDGGRPPLAP